MLCVLLTRDSIPSIISTKFKLFILTLQYAYIVTDILSNKFEFKVLSKSDTKILKGCAILIMLWLHLFNNLDRTLILENFIIINGLPLVYLISKFASVCVSLYLFIGGYGLYLSWKSDSKKSNNLRILLLYLNFWLVFALFIGLASFVNPEKYPGSIIEFISNITAWKTSYNWEWWFLFPYIIIILISKWLFNLIEKYKTIPIIILFGLIYFVAIALKFIYRDSCLLNNQFLYMPILVASLIFPFILGALSAKNSWVEKFRTYIISFKHTNMFLLFALLLLVILMMVVPVYVQAFIIPFVVLAFVPVFSNLRKSVVVKNVLLKLGEESTNMWLVHTFFCYYLFSDFIYGFRYPIIIFLVLTVICYLVSRLINIVYKPIAGRIGNFVSGRLRD